MFADENAAQLEAQRQQEEARLAVRPFLFRNTSSVVSLTFRVIRVYLVFDHSSRLLQTNRRWRMHSLPSAMVADLQQSLRLPIFFVLSLPELIFTCVFVRDAVNVGSKIGTIPTLVRGSN